MIGALVIIIVLAGLIGIRFFLQTRSGTPASTTDRQTPVEVPATSPQTTLEERVRALEVALADVVSVLKSVSPDQAVAGEATLDSRVKILETSISDLQSRLKILEGGSKSTAAQTQTAAKSPVYIPLRWVGSTTSSDWNHPGVAEISISGADYPGYSSMVLEVSIKSSNSGKRAYARLYNKDDNSAITTSEASTDVTAYTLASSSSFTVPGSRKTYILQMKSQDGVGAQIQDASIRVNF